MQNNWPKFSYSNPGLQTVPLLKAGGRRDGGDILAGWYSGTLIVPTGEMVEYVHMGYGSTYSRYLVISVHKGEVTRQLDLDDKQFMALRRERFKAFQKTKLYQDQIAETRKQLGKNAEDFMFSFYAEQYLSEDPESGVQ